jgi:hypothetical protein
MRVCLMRLRNGDGSVDPHVFAVVKNRRAATKLLKKLQLETLRVASDFAIEEFAVHE